MSEYGLYIVTLLVNIIVIPFLSVPIITDEVNPLAFGFMLQGENWSQFLLQTGTITSLGNYSSICLLLY